MRTLVVFAINVVVVGMVVSLCVGCQGYASGSGQEPRPQVIGLSGPQGPQGDPGTPAISFVTLVAHKYHSPSVFVPHIVELPGLEARVPASLRITQGCGSNDGGPNRAAQLEFGTIVCRYNPTSTLNKPCEGTNAGQIAASLVYVLDTCDDDAVAGDYLDATIIGLNLSKSDSSVRHTSIQAKLEVR